MFFLAGLLGMMALGSVVMVSTSPDDDELAEDTSNPVPEDGFDGGGDISMSLFEQMGLPQSGTEAGLNSDDTDMHSDTHAGEIIAGGATDNGSLAADDDMAQFMDFDRAEDQLMVVYDDSMGEESPELEIRPSAEDENTTEVVVGGIVLATMPTEDAPVLDSVVLVGESTASELAVA